MKKTIGWVIVVISYLFLFFFVLGIIFHLTDDEPMQGMPSTGETLISYFICILMFTFLLRLGKKIIRDNSIKTVPYSDTLSIQFKGQISYADYRNATFSIVLRSPAFQIFLFVPFVFILLYFTTNNVNGYWLLGAIAFAYIVLPIITLNKIKKNYLSMKLFQSDTEYRITNDSLQVIGEDINSNSRWNTFIRSRETKEFILMYESQVLAVFLSKKLFTPQDLTAFKQFLKSLPIPHH